MQDWNAKLAFAGMGLQYWWGIALCQVSACLYACGICTQRYALGILGESKAPLQRPGSMPVDASVGQPLQPYRQPDSMSFLRRNRQHVVWVMGFFLWGLGNMLYMFALNFAPLSLLMSLFDTVLIFNAVLAGWLLREEVTKWDVIGWSIIGVGISLCGIFIPKAVKILSADEMIAQAGHPIAFLYLAIVVCMLVGLTIAIHMYERLYPHGSNTESARTKFLATLAYPTVLALYESLIQICLKGVSNMLSETLSGTTQLTNWKFWLVTGIMGLTCLGVMWWMRKGYARFEAVAMLPIQMAVLTTSTVLGGLMFYEEYMVRCHNTLKLHPVLTHSQEPHARHDPGIVTALIGRRIWTPQNW